MIAIHNSGQWSFRPEWVDYCDKNGIPYKLVNAYDSNIIEQLQDCTAFMFHFHHTIPSDYIFAQQLLFSLEQTGLKVFPDFNTAWHFDDKLGQKYLLERIGAKMPKTEVFYDKESAMEFINTTTLPLVFKLRGGAGSNNVSLIRTLDQGIKLINKAFGSGFDNYNRIGDFNEVLTKWKKNSTSTYELLKSIRRIFVGTEFSKTAGKERSYFIVQEFIANNDHDIRIVVIGDKAFAIKRLVRKNDFRASGSGSIIYDKNQIPRACISYSFEISKKLGLQCCAYDFVFDEDNTPLIVEINYGFAHRSYDGCDGYWLDDFSYINEKINPCGWMVDLVK
jgi:glutathione synthase/RimK-type ligase-like ATP-grasp enzyme